MKKLPVIQSIQYKFNGKIQPVDEELPMSLLLKKKRGKDRLEHEHALAMLKTSHIRRENRILWVSTILSFTIATLAVIFRG